MSAKVRVSPVSKTAAILIVAVGVFTLLAGLDTGITSDTVAGGAIVVLGVVLYVMLYRINRRLEEDLDGMKSASAPASGQP